MLVTAAVVRNRASCGRACSTLIAKNGAYHAHRPGADLFRSRSQPISGTVHAIMRRRSCACPPSSQIRPHASCMGRPTWLTPPSGGNSATMTGSRSSAREATWSMRPSRGGQSNRRAWRWFVERGCQWSRSWWRRRQNKKENVSGYNWRHCGAWSVAPFWQPVSSCDCSDLLTGYCRLRLASRGEWFEPRVDCGAGSPSRCEVQALTGGVSELRPQSGVSNVAHKMCGWGLAWSLGNAQ